ncbi:MAG: hypothetical protein L6243_00870, partial [Candidatus Altiarchaeales archaeon]|nr:hypothetical protein [Candidatus Altiarchaeales archaeon]
AKDTIGLKRQIRETIMNLGLALEEEMETCPGCGREALVDELLSRGCCCGWVSPRMREEIIAVAK